MPASEPGRRDNGLASADWGALVDLDPRLSNALLEQLARAGVAAFVEPAGGMDAVTRGVTMPDRPLDRLWVDPARAEAARTVVSALTAELDDAAMIRAVPRGSARRVLPPPRLGKAPDPVDDDAAFAEIIAGFHLESDSPVPRWPVSEDVSQDVDADRKRAQEIPPAAPASDTPTPHRRRTDELPDWVEPDEIEPDEDDHYVPPPPPPLKRFRATTVAYVLAMLAGILIAFAPDLVGLPDGNDTRTLGMVLLAAGAGMLIWSMHDSSDDDPDEGAVV